jgi:hypothetical protein
LKQIAGVQALAATCRRGFVLMDGAVTLLRRESHRTRHENNVIRSLSSTVYNALPCGWNANHVKREAPITKTPDSAS